MLTKKKLKATLLSLLLVATMLIPTFPVYATEQVVSVDALNDHLLVHYDFEGDTTEEKLKDKAHGIGVSAVADNLNAYTNLSNFTFANGVVTAIGNDSLVNVADSADVKSVANYETKEATWIIRYQVSDLTNLQGDAYLFDMEDSTNASFSVIADLRKNNDYIRWSKWNTAWEQITSDSWKQGNWETMVVTRIYDTENDKYTMTTTIYNGAELLPVDTSGYLTTDLGSSSRNPRLSLFALYQENNNLLNTYTYANGASIDDFRLYDKALSADEIASVLDEFKLDQHLLVHYDFEGVTIEDVLSDKAHGNKSSSVADNLSAVSNIDNFVFANGVVTAKGNDRLLNIQSSPDVQSVATHETKEATWVIRYQVTNLDSMDSSSYLFDMEDSRSLLYSTYSNLRKNDTVIRWSQWHLTHASKYSTISTDTWKNGTWETMVITRTYSASEDKFRMTATIYNGAETLPTGACGYTTENFGTDVRDPRLAFFGYYHEQYPNSAFGYANGASIDDFRLYDKALSADEITEVLTALNSATEDPADIINLGAQKTIATREGTKVRLVAAINGYQYKASGFKVSATWDGKTTEDNLLDFPCYYAYTALLAEDNNGDTSPITPADKNYYLIAVVIDDIPEDKTNVKLTFTPYVISTDGSESLVGETFIYNVTQNTCERAA